MSEQTSETPKTVTVGELNIVIDSEFNNFAKKMAELLPKNDETFSDIKTMVLDILKCKESAKMALNNYAQLNSQAKDGEDASDSQA